MWRGHCGLGPPPENVATWAEVLPEGSVTRLRTTCLPQCHQLVPTRILVIGTDLVILTAPAGRIILHQGGPESQGATFVWYEKSLLVVTIWVSFQHPHYSMFVCLSKGFLCFLHTVLTRSLSGLLHVFCSGRVGGGPGLCASWLFWNREHTRLC